MNILAVDYGHKRVGLAYADSDLGVAVPIPAAVESSGEERLRHIASEIKNRKIEKIVVSYPLNMDGSRGEKAMEVDAYILKLSELFGLPVEKTDERLSSYQAEHDFFSMGGKAGKSVAARQRHRRSGGIDSRAAALFLQEYLDCGGREVL